MRVPQRFQYETDLTIIRGCIVPYGKDRWNLYCNDPAVNIEDTMSVEDLEECLSYLHSFKWLENDANFPGPTIERELPSDEQCRKLIYDFRDNPTEDMGVVVRNWFKTINR